LPTFHQDPAEDGRQKLANFAAFADNLAVPIFILDVDDDGTIRFHKNNLEHERRTGLDSKSVIGKTPHDLLPPRTADTILKNYQTCVDRREEYRYEEHLILASEEQWWETTLSPVFDNDRVIGIVGVAHNLTPWKENEREFVNALRELNRTHTDLEVLTSATAHDLRGPLRQARLIYDMVLDGFEDLGDNKLELLQSGGQIIDKALVQIDDVLSQSRKNTTSAGRFKPVDFGHVCADLAAVLDPLKTLSFKHDRGMVLCEKFILDIVLRNLVDNAIKHARSQVSVTVRAEDDALVISVSDDGPGFDPERIKVGEQMTAGSKIDGITGFGLAGAIQLLDVRGGKMWLDIPVFGAGATVSFRIDGELSDAPAHVPLPTTD